MRQAISYVRWSSERQRYGQSLRRQVELRDRLCVKQGWILNETLRFHDEGKSGWHGYNAKFGALAGFLDAVKNGRIATGSVLIVERLDRLTRDDIDEALMLFIGVIRSGIDIATVEPERIYTAETIKKPEVLNEAMYMFATANEESNKKSSRSLDNWQQKRKTARESGTPIGKRTPWWLAFEGGKYVPVPDRVEVVRRMFALRCQGHGFGAIVKRLNAAEGPRPMSGKAWSIATVATYIRGRTVLGEYQPTKLVGRKKVPDGNPIRDFYPAVVGEEEYYRAQGSRQHQGRKPSDPIGGLNIFKGLLFSSRDKTAFQLSTTHRGRGVYRFFQSAAYLAGSPDADPGLFHYLPYETAFLRYVRELDPADFVPGGGDIAGQVAEVSGRIMAVEHRLAATRKRAIEADEGAVDQYYLMIDELSAERRDLLARLQTLKVQQSSYHVDAVGEVRSLLDLLANVEDQDREDLKTQIRQRIRQLVKRVEVEVVEEGRGKPGKGQGRTRRYALRSVIHFHDGRERSFWTNEDGDLTEGLTWYKPAAAVLPVPEFPPVPDAEVDPADVVAELPF